MTEPSPQGFSSRRSPAWVTRLLPTANLLCDRYFHLQVEGREHIPEGPALYVSNHNNGLAGPDILCALTTLWNTLGPTAPVYGLAHDFAMQQAPAIGALLSRFGALRATPDNAHEALSAGAHVLVYPGGDLEAYRHFRRRNEIVLGPRAGFVRSVQRSGAWMVPLVAAGAHRSAVVLTEGEAIARVMKLKSWARLERFPVALALPWGIALGPWLPWLPLPFPIRLRFLPPRKVREDEDPDLVREALRGEMQSALDDMVAQTRPR